MCQCGRAQDDHDSVATADAYGAAVTSKWNVVHHTSDYPTDAFGELEFIGTGRRHYPVSGGALYSHLHLVIFILSVLETCRFEEVVLWDVQFSLGEFPLFYHTKVKTNLKKRRF